MPSLKHIHTYVRFKQKSGKTLKTWWWRCENSLCTHFAPYEMVVGKKTLCTNCGSEMILTSEDMRRIRPRCLACSNTKEAAMQKRLASILSSVLPPDLEESTGSPKEKWFND